VKQTTSDDDNVMDGRDWPRNKVSVYDSSVVLYAVNVCTPRIYLYILTLYFRSSPDLINY